MLQLNCVHNAGTPRSTKYQVRTSPWDGRPFPQAQEVVEGVEGALAELAQSAWAKKGGQAPGLLPEAPTCMPSYRAGIESAAEECLRA